jgi:SAM-dependent methyltransferase
MPQEFLHKLRSAGPVQLFRRGMRKLVPYRLRCYAHARGLFTDKVGIEFGGPSSIFGARGIFPVYPLAARIDNCNFDYQTLWEGTITPPRGFRFDKRRAPGRQFVAEANELGFIPDNMYDFVLSSHMIEHSANPIKALHEWLRVLKPEGTLLMVLTHRDGTFDHRRPVTPLRHLVNDFERQMAEDDLTHLPEILELHDLRRDPEAGGLRGVQSTQRAQSREPGATSPCVRHETRRGVAGPPGAADSGGRKHLPVSHSPDRDAARGGPKTRQRDFSARQRGLPTNELLPIGSPGPVTPSISVVTATFNCGPDLARLITSLRGQTDREFDFVVILLERRLRKRH